MITCIPHGGNGQTLSERARKSALSRLRSLPEQNLHVPPAEIPSTSLERKLIQVKTLLSKWCVKMGVITTMSRERRDVDFFRFIMNRSLLDTFAVPQDLLENTSLIPVFNPGVLSHRDIVMCLRAHGINVQENLDVMSLTGSEPCWGPSLQLISSSEYPYQKSMGLSADHLLTIGRSYLDLQGYGLAQLFFHSLTGRLLDNVGGDTLVDANVSVQTLFPANRIIPVGLDERVDLTGLPVAYGYCDPIKKQIVLGSHGEDVGFSAPNAGIRMVQHIPFK